MRKITEQSINAFTAGKPFSRENMTVTVCENGDKYLTLHGNVIAKKEDGELYITNAGWFSVTTKDRLNGLPGVRVGQQKGVWYLNGHVWDGKWIKVGSHEEMGIDKVLTKYV